MIAFDTNVLVRVLTNDDPAQARRALRRAAVLRALDSFDRDLAKVAKRIGAEPEVAAP